MVDDLAVVGLDGLSREELLAVVSSQAVLLEAQKVQIEARGVRTNDRTIVGPPQTNDDEAAYHRHLTRTINARYGEAVRAWEERIVGHVGKRDEQTIELAKQLDKLQRRGVDAEQVLDLAVRHKPLPVDRATAALAYRVRGIAAAQQGRQAPTTNPFHRRPTQSSGPAMGM